MGSGQDSTRKRPGQDDENQKLKEENKKLKKELEKIKGKDCATSSGATSGGVFIKKEERFIEGYRQFIEKDRAAKNLFNNYMDWYNGLCSKMQKCLLYSYRMPFSGYTYFFVKIGFDKQFDNVKVQNSYISDNWDYQSRDTATTIKVSNDLIPLRLGRLSCVIILHPSDLGKIVEMDKNKKETTVATTTPTAFSRYSTTTTTTTTTTEDFTTAERITSDFYQGYNELIICCSSKSL